MTFKERVDKDYVCPKCKSVIIFMYGTGIDYDREHCSNRECDYEIEYETTTDISEDNTNGI